MNRGFLILLIIWTSLPIAQAQTPATIFPAAAWDKADATRSEWSGGKLAEARRYFDGLASGSAVVVEHGRVVVEWGDPAKRVKLSSVRKSFLSALYGIHVRAGRLDLSKTLAQLGIDDRPPLTTVEKTATLRMVLQARSGVYHPYVGGLLADREAMPPRGSHPPGSFWYYNNWDFNVLGTAFELGGNQLPPVPLSGTQEQIAEAGHVPRRHAEVIGGVNRLLHGSGLRRAAEIVRVLEPEVLHLDGGGDPILKLRRDLQVQPLSVASVSPSCPC